MNEKKNSRVLFSHNYCFITSLFTTYANALHRSRVCEFEFHSIQVRTFRATFAFNFENSSAKNRKRSCKMSARNGWVNVLTKLNRFTYITHVLDVR